jgi:hypothetical protein
MQGLVSRPAVALQMICCSHYPPVVAAEARRPRARGIVSCASPVLGDARRPPQRRQERVAIARALDPALVGGVLEAMKKLAAPRHERARSFVARILQAPTGAGGLPGAGAGRRGPGPRRVLRMRKAANPAAGTSGGPGGEPKDLWLRSHLPRVRSFSTRSFGPPRRTDQRGPVRDPERWQVNSGTCWGSTSWGRCPPRDSSISAGATCADGSSRSCMLVGRPVLVWQPSSPTRESSGLPAGAGPAGRSAGDPGRSTGFQLQGGR